MTIADLVLGPVFRQLGTPASFTPAADPTAGVAFVVIPVSPERLVEHGGLPVVPGSAVVELAVAAVPIIVPGDRLTWNGRTWIITAAWHPDPDRLVWRLALEPVGA